MERSLDNNWKIPHHPESPCLGCHRDKDNHGCGSEGCVTWREWFKGKWRDVQKSAGIERDEEME